MKLTATTNDEITKTEAHCLIRHYRFEKECITPSYIPSLHHPSPHCYIGDVPPITAPLCMHSLNFPKAIEGLPKATEDSMRYVGVSYGSATKQRFPKPSEVGSKSGQSTGGEQKSHPKDSFIIFPPLIHWDGGAQGRRRRSRLPSLGLPLDPRHPH